MPNEIKKELMTVPGVGKRVAEDFYELGIKRVRDLRGKDPERLYQKLCKLQNKKLDRCMLYVMRCAVYYASHDTHESALLKWWNWKDIR